MNSKVTVPKSNDACPLCGDDSRRMWGAVGRYALIACRNCALIVTRPLPEQKDLDAVYGAHDYYSASSLHPERNEKDARRRLAAVERWISPGRLLEIGPGHGWFAKEAVRHGWQVTAIEPSANLAASLSSVETIEVLQQRLEETVFSEPFDAVVAWEVIEHTTDPDKFLDAMAGAVRAGGIMGVSSPNMGGWLALLAGKHHPMIIPPEHLHYFHYKTLRMWAKRYGFLILERASSSHLDSATLRRGISRRVLQREISGSPSTLTKLLFGAISVPILWADRLGWGTQLECILRKDEERK